MVDIGKESGEAQRTLIIGASLIGSQVARTLVDVGQSPVLFDKSFQESAIDDIVDLAKVRLETGDVLNLSELGSVIKKHKISSIVHLAANPMLTKGAQEDPYNAIELNVMGTVNVLESARQLSLNRVIVASSSAVFESLDGGGDEGGRSQEEYFPRPMTFYGATKQAAENIGLNYAKHFGIEYVGLRFASVAGPWRGRGGGAPSVMFREIVTRAMSRDSVVVQPRYLDWLYVKDAAAVVAVALQAVIPHSRIFNVAMGKVYGPQELRQEILKVFPDAGVIIEPEEPKSISKPTPMDITRLSGELGFTPRYSMQMALQDCAEFYSNCSAKDETVL